MGGRPVNFDPERKPLCECSRPKVPKREACESCLDKDGRTAEERDVISALRVLGGHAQMAAIVEDIGGSLHEGHDGPGHRRAYRGLARLRQRGSVGSVDELGADMGLPMPSAFVFVPVEADVEAEGLYGRHGAKLRRRGFYRLRKKAGRGEGRKTEGGGVVTYSLKAGW
jgi:hypothetical protein